MNLSEIMRPKALDEVIGNEHIIKPLRNQLESGTLSQSLMIVGQYGSGKTTLAKIIANHLQAEVYEVDCGSDGGIDRIREVVDAASMSSLFSTAKVFILDEVHGLSKASQSALLKTLEEPRPNLYFILLTTEDKKVLPTIRSRCVVYTTKAATREHIGEAVKRVLAKYELTVESMADFWAVVEQADGSLRQVYAIVEKLVAAADENKFLSSAVFQSVVGSHGKTEVNENLPLAYLKGDIAGVLEAVRGIKNSEATTVGTAIGVYNYLKSVYLKGNKGNKELIADLVLLLTHKQIEWEHFEWLAWKHL